jgi:isovaleryl-CoA dehydrogenase
MSGLNTERLVLSGGPIGLMQAAMDLALPYVRERKQFDRRSAPSASCRPRSPTCTPRCKSSRAFAYQVARDYDAGHKSPHRRRQLPAACIEAAVQVALEGIQALGGNGYINEYPTGRILRDAKLYAIGAGTNEIRRMLIGRELFAGNS